MPKLWDTWMMGFAGALVGLLASIAHIMVDRSEIGTGPVPFGQVPIYVFAIAGLFAAISMGRNHLVMRHRPPAPPNT